ncbi:hypothetical protein PV417_28525 [Streptomyces sp. ME19-03-3]|nr:hypothetical protein [Streptomyces sp. ME19-03-3]
MVPARCAQAATAAAAVLDVFRAVAVQNRQIHPAALLRLVIERITTLRGGAFGAPAPSSSVAQA